MWERMLDFTPSLVAMIFIFILLAGINWLAERLYGKKSKDAEWCFENFFKMFWLTKGIKTCVKAPVFEEMLFRLPIIILFPVLTVYAGIGIALSSVLFAALHWYNFPEKKAPERLMSLIPFLILGIICGLSGILLQTVWIAVIAHFMWNLFCTEAHYIILRQNLVDIKNNPERLAQLKDSLNRKNNLSPPAENING